MINLRHDENPSEMKWLVAVRRFSRTAAAWGLAARRRHGVDSTSVPEVQGKLEAGYPRQLQGNERAVDAKGCFHGA
jgi:hypothetical protein